MKILWISHFLLYPETGYGALQRSRNLMIELGRRHDVYLVSYYRRKDLEMGTELTTARTDLEKHCKEVILLPYPGDIYWFKKYLMIMRSIFMTPYSTQMYFSKLLTDTAVKAVEEHHVDILHSDTMGLVESVIDKVRCQKTLNHHNIESDMMYRRSDKEHNILKKLFYLWEARKLRAYERKYCPLYDTNLVVSELDKERLIELADNIRVNVIENGVDCNYFQYRYRGGPNKELIFFGSLDWYPNSDAMIYFVEEMWPTLKNIHSELKLTIVGKNPSDKLRALIDAQTDINHIGFVKDIRSSSEKARIFICPMRDGGGTRLKILDALAQGLPVVSTQIGAEGLGLENKKNILIADTPEDFIRHIEELLINDTLCMRLSRNGREFIEEKFCYDTIGSKLCGLYHEIAQMNNHHNQTGGSECVE